MLVRYAVGTTIETSYFYKEDKSPYADLIFAADVHGHSSSGIAVHSSKLDKLECWQFFRITKI